jgi:hypothetical protein
MVSNESDIESNQEIASAPMKIRSRHRRRLLNRLTDGGDTVSALARDVNLQVPHASAELRRLRNEGLVSSDAAVGSRGGRLHLTELGWGVIRSDELARALEALPLPREEGKFCLLDRDGENVLIGLTSSLFEPMVLIPNRPPVRLNEDTNSSGNEGVRWNWAILRERSPRWFDLESREISESAPPTSDPSRIESYVETPTVIGIIRAKLVQPDLPIAIAPGHWFDPPSSGQSPPLPENSYHRGDWVLGAVHELTQDVRPKVPICAILVDRLSKSMLLRTARINSLVIADLSGIDAEGDEYPLSALDFWIQRAHPRLSEAERRKRVQSLRDRIVSTKKIRTDESTWRRFRRDWGNSTFTEAESGIRILETRGIENSAVESLIRWSLAEEDKPPLVLELNSGLPADVFSSISIHPKLRLIISEQKKSQFEAMDVLEIDSFRPLPWLKLTSTTGLSIPIRLLDQLSQTTPILDEKIGTAPTPWQIVGLSEKYDCEAQELKSGYLSMVNSAVAQYPNGNEDWANQMEAAYPIAAWIASPRGTRWPRWQRLRTRLDADWMILFDLDFIPLERLSELADEAPEMVLNHYSIEIQRKIREKPEIALRIRPAVDPSAASKGAAWVAAQFLANAPWIPIEMHEDLLKWAMEAWLTHPPSRSLAALEGVSWMYSPKRGRAIDFGPILQGILSTSKNLLEGHDLRLWSKLVDRMLDDVPLSLDDLERVVEHLPKDWWAPVAPEFLKNILEFDDATDWLIEKSLPWSAVILRPIGEPSQAPGLSGFEHPGCDSELYSSLARQLRGRRQREGLSVSADSLLDLLDAIESVVENRSPIPGRTHPLVGWLAQPLDRWPDISPESALIGDSAVGERLLAKKTGFHPELLSINL